MKVVKTIALLVLALIVVGVVVVATRPAEFRIERSIVIEAPPSAVQPHVASLRAWRAWSPWENLDPDMARSYSGPDAGVGASYEWRGDEVGAGRMTVVESTPEKVGIELEFIEPMAATNQAIFTLEPVPEGTRVVWAMEGRNGFLGKAFSLVVGMDELVGAQFERGLAELKAVAEGAAATAPG